MTLRADEIAVNSKEMDRTFKKFLYDVNGHPVEKIERVAKDDKSDKTDDEVVGRINRFGGDPRNVTSLANPLGWLDITIQYDK